MTSPIILGRDVASLGPNATAVLDDQSAIFPISRLQQLRPGTYAIQALMHTNRDLNLANAPGDLYSEVTLAGLDPTSGGLIKLTLSQAVPNESLPADQELVKYLKVPSRLLSDFHGRPIALRAGVILPRDYTRHPEQRYPVRVHVGGYGSRFTGVGDMMNPESGFYRAWMADDAPSHGARSPGRRWAAGRSIPDRFGQPRALWRGRYQELIPLIETTFRGIGEGHARVLDGGSTGGWVALALQVFYPNFFNGAWAFCPDSVDFRSFQLVNIYDDDNAYVNSHGFERPGARDISGEVRYTMRHECQLENVLGRRDSWRSSGGQWGAWNATYSDRSPDGQPVPLWNPTTGAIDRKAVAYWKRYDLRRHLEENWSELGPKLKGKLHIWVGDADDFFLNNAVHRLDAFLCAWPPYEGSIVYGRRQGHCWMGISETAMMKQMAGRVAGAPSATNPFSP